MIYSDDSFSVKLNSVFALTANVISSNGRVHIHGEKDNVIDFYSDFLNYEVRDQLEDGLEYMLNNITIVAHDIIKKTTYENSQTGLSMGEYLGVKFLLKGYLNDEIGEV